MTGLYTLALAGVLIALVLVALIGAALALCLAVDWIVGLVRHRLARRRMQRAGVVVLDGDARRRLRADRPGGLVQVNGRGGGTAS